MNFTGIFALLGECIQIATAAQGGIVKDVRQSFRIGSEVINVDANIGVSNAALPGVEMVHESGMVLFSDILVAIATLAETKTYTRDFSYLISAGEYANLTLTLTAV